MQHIANCVVPDASAVSIAGSIGSYRLRGQSVRATAIDAAKILELIEAPSRSTNAQERVPHLISAAARLVGGDSCAIVLMEETEGGQLVLRPYAEACIAANSANNQWTREEEGAARRAIASGEPVLIDLGEARSDDDSSKQAPMPAPGRSIIACPVRIDGTIIGAISVAGGDAFRRFHPNHVAAVEIAGWLVGHALHANRLQNLLKSQFAQLAIAREAGASPDNVLAVSRGRPGQLARILAKSFYREMIELGFESGQIISAASEIISQLSGNLKKHKERWQRSRAGRQQLGAGSP